MPSVLLAVCGLVPQILTETLHALHTAGEFPARVVVLTTQQGAERLHAALLGENGVLARFLREHNLPACPPACPLTREDIIVPTVAARPVQDITTLEESTAFQEIAMRHAWELTQAPRQRVDFSIAGGRKTMSASLALAAQCYGRPHDRMFHVLVAPEFEGKPDFFYPSPCEAAAARITLAPVPFARLRPYLPPALLQRPELPQHLLNGLQLGEDAPLYIDIPQRRLVLGAAHCQLPPALLALFLWFARRKSVWNCAGHCPTCADCPCFADSTSLLDAATELANDYARVRVSSAASSDTGILNLNQENFLAYKAKINQRLRRALGGAAALAEIAAVGTRPHVRYGLHISRACIRIVGG